MVRPDGYVKLLDFGLARLHDATIAATLTSPADRGGPGPRHDWLHGARTGSRRDRCAGGGRLRARSPAVRAGDRPSPVHGPVADCDAQRVDVGNAGAARRAQPRSAARHRSTDRRSAAEGSAAAARRGRGDVSPQHRARLLGCGGDVQRPGRASALRGQRHDRRTRVESSMPCIKSSFARSADRVGSSWSRPKLEWERRHWSRRSCGSSRNQANRFALAAGDVQSVSRAPKPTCRCSRPSIASSTTNNWQSLAVFCAALHPAGTPNSCRRAENDSSAARLAAETLAGSQERLKFEIAALLEEARAPAAGGVVVRRSALGRSVDDRSAWLCCAAAGSHACADRHHLPAVSAGADAASVSRAETPSPGARPGYRNHARHPRRSRHRSLHRAAVPEQRISIAICRADLGTHRGQPSFMADLLRDLKRRQVLRRQDDQWIVAEDLSALERELRPRSAA